MVFDIENGILQKYSEPHRSPEVVIPEGVTCIGEAAFYGCRMESVILPESLTEIRDFAFGRCTALKSITLPKKLTRIRVGTFRDCSRLCVTIPEGVTEIGWWAFVKCRQVTLPDSITAIGDHAFDQCCQVVSHGVTIESSDLAREQEDITKLVQLVALRKELDWQRYDVSGDPSCCRTIWKMLVADPEDVQVIAYIQNLLFELFSYLVDRGDTELLEQVLASELFCLEEYIDELLEYAHRQGQLDSWLLLLRYKNEKLGFSTEPLSL